MKPATLREEIGLRLVVEKPVNVSDLVRADIAKRDWSRAMLWADKQKPVQLPDARKWGWRG